MVLEFYLSGTETGNRNVSDFKAVIVILEERN